VLDTNDEVAYFPCSNLGLGVVDFRSYLGDDVTDRSTRYKDTSSSGLSEICVCVCVGAGGGGWGGGG